MKDQNNLSCELSQKNIFMIMCHKNAAQVLRLAKKCLSDSTDVIVHADIEMPLDEYCLLENFAHSNSRFFLTDRRLHGELSKESLIHITMEMVRKAYCIENDTNQHYKYFCLLSGQDYLIKPLKFIEKELSANYPKPYIDCDPYDKNNWMYKKFRWNTFTNKIRLKIDKIFKNRYRDPVRVVLMVLLYSLNKLMQPIMPSIYHQIKKIDVNIYGGSAWWMLPDIAMRDIYKKYKESGPLVELLLQAITPEELFFQIMSMQSPVKDLIEVKPVDSVGQNCKTWAYFYDDDKPPAGHPYIFTVNEYAKLIKSDKWIARKFDEKVDSEIMDMIDQYLGQQTE